MYIERQVSVSYQIYGLCMQSNMQFPQLPSTSREGTDISFCLIEPKSWGGWAFLTTPQEATPALSPSGPAATMSTGGGSFLTLPSQWTVGP